MFLKNTSFSTFSRRGFWSIFGAYRGLSLCLLIAFSLTLSMIAFDPTRALSFLSFPLVLGLAILAGLMFGYGGAIASFVITVVVGTWLMAEELGIFQTMTLSEGSLFVFGNAVTMGFFSIITALAMGYSRRQSEMASDRQNLLRKVFHSLPIGVCVRARDGRTIFLNERWASFTPYTVDEILFNEINEPGLDFDTDWESLLQEVVDSENSAVHYRNIERVDDSGVKCKMTLLTLRMLIDQENDFGTLSLLVDETALLIYQEKVRQSERNLQLALNNAKMGYWLENIETKEVQCDANWYALICAKAVPEVSPIAEWTRRLHPDDAPGVRQAYRDFYKSGLETMRLDYRILRGQNGFIWVQDSALVTERNESGHAVCIMGTMQDINEQKLSEIELLSAKEKAEAANQAKSQFIATISHEIRTPLNAIIGLSSFLTESSLEADQLDLAETIHASGKTLLSMLNAILDFSSIEAGRLRFNMQEFPLTLCIEDSIKLFKVKAAEKGLDLHLHLADQLPEFVFGDMARLRQVLQNLLSNAIKFTESGSVVVIVRPVEAESLELLPGFEQPLPEGSVDHPAAFQYIEVRIKDTGLGIADEKQHLLFKAFSQVDSSMTRRFEGTGLGLVICKRIVDAMRGRIWVKSEAGQGAEFCFVVGFRLADGPSAVAGEVLFRQDATAPYPSREGRLADVLPLDILVVGPDEVARKLVDACHRLGYRPHHAQTYDLNGSVFLNRDYEVILIAVDPRLESLRTVRQLNAPGRMAGARSIIGFTLGSPEISREQYRLGGLDNLVEEKPSVESVRRLLSGLTRGRD